MSECVSKYRLMQLLSGDLEERDDVLARQHIETCEACRSELAAMAHNIADFEQRKEARLDSLLAAIDTPKRRIPRRRTVAYGVAAAALLALALGFMFRNETTETGDIVFKGRLSVEIVAKRDDRQFSVTDGDILYEADALRFVVTTIAAGYLTIFSIDDNGTVWNYYPETDPEDNPDPLRLEGSGRHELPGSVVLDQMLGKEQFVVAFSPEPFDRRAFTEKWAIRRNTGETDEFRKDIAIESIRVVKEKKPR
jgi:hypothetical protein